jgi:hypothetical protein
MRPTALHRKSPTPAAAPIVTSGATINAQVWARDPANQDGFLLSDGLEVVVCPGACRTNC